MTKYEKGQKVVLKGTYSWTPPPDEEDNLTPKQRFKQWCRENDLNLKKGSIVTITDIRTYGVVDEEYWIEDVDDGAFRLEDFEPYKTPFDILDEKLTEEVCRNTKKGTK